MRIVVLFSLSILEIAAPELSFAKAFPEEEESWCPMGQVLTPDGELQEIPLSDCTLGNNVASFNVPYYFSYYNSKDFENSVRDSLQAMGFSFTPELFRRPNPDECVSAGMGGSMTQFWTDWLVIDDGMLDAFQLDRESFDVSLNERHEYRIQIYGCFSGGSVVKYVPVPGDECVYRQTTMFDGPNSNLIAFVDVEHRGSGGTWRAYEDQEFDTVPFLTSVDARLRVAIDSVEPQKVEAAEYRVCEG